MVQGWRLDCLNGELRPPDELWADIRHKRYEAPLRAVRLAYVITEELCAAAPVLRGELTPVAYEEGASCAATLAIRNAVVRELVLR